jgi:hypothetical protein
MLQARLRSGGGMMGGDQDEDEDFEDVDDDDDEDERGFGGMRRRRPKKYYEPVTEPLDAGVSLERSGQFGIVRLTRGGPSNRSLMLACSSPASQKVRICIAQVHRLLSEPGHRLPSARVRPSSNSQVVHRRRVSSPPLPTCWC